MKIEKINENQIRCTLTRQDLENHHIRLSELAYGTDKAKQLFRDMMQQAQVQFGFEADNIPLMIEAIPVSAESIILIITKVEDPEELDTRFSKFAPFKNAQLQENIQLDGADSILDLFQKIREARQKIAATKQGEETAAPAEAQAASESTEDVNILRLFIFPTLDHVIKAAQGLNGFYQGENLLYRENSANEYHLVLHQSSCSPEDFNRVCNILSEYGVGKPLQRAGEAYLLEHGDLITKDALQQLSKLNQQ
ncbi:MAG: adaptor protein MecA [Blautia sp.]|nr:adaptor protein MecA [Blautia sp.]